MKKLESMTKKLQDPKLTTSDIRVLFDFVIENFPGMSHYLLADAEIIQDPILERAIVKIQDGQLKKSSVLNASSSSQMQLPLPKPCNAQESVSSAEMALKRQRTAAPASASSHRGARGGQAGCSGGHHECDVPVQPQYQPLHFIPPTSNICEQFFSLAKLVYADLRKAMKCTTLESLHLNRYRGIRKWYRWWLETRVTLWILTMFLMRSSLDITLTQILKSCTLALYVTCMHYNE